MRIERQDIRKGAIAAGALLLLEAAVCRVVKGRFFAYPWLQRGSSLALGIAVVLSHAQKAEQPLSIATIGDLSNAELVARADEWKNDFKLVKWITRDQLTHLFWEGVDSLALRREMYWRSRPVQVSRDDGPWWDDRLTKWTLDPPAGDWKAVVSPWFEKFYKRYLELDCLPIHFLRVSFSSPFAWDRTSQWRFISWLWWDSDFDWDWGPLCSEIMAFEEDELEGERLDAWRALDLYCFGDSGTSVRRPRDYAAYLIGSGRTSLEDQLPRDRSAADLSGLGLTSLQDELPCDQRGFERAYRELITSYWQEPSNRSALAPHVASSIAFSNMPIGFNLFVETINALDEGSWEGLTRWRVLQNKLKRRFGTLKRLIASRATKGPLDLPRDVRMMIWSFLSATERAAVGVVCRRWCADVQAMLWAESAGKDVDQWIETIKAARCPRLAEELADLWRVVKPASEN